MSEQQEPVLTNAFAQYREECIHPGAPDGQVVECQQAFFAGAWALMQRLVAAATGANDEGDDTEFNAVCDSVFHEIDAFNETLAELKARADAPRIARP